MENKEDNKPSNWIDTPYTRAPWVPIKHGEVVEPPNEQDSNLKLADREVMKSRTEKIGGDSNAFPLQGFTPHPGDHSGNKKIRST